VPMPLPSTRKRLRWQSTSRITKHCATGHHVQKRHQYFCVYCLLRHCVHRLHCPIQVPPVCISNSGVSSCFQCLRSCCLCHYFPFVIMYAFASRCCQTPVVSSAVDVLAGLCRCTLAWCASSTCSIRRLHLRGSFHRSHACCNIGRLLALCCCATGDRLRWRLP